MSNYHCHCGNKRCNVDSDRDKRLSEAERLLDHCHSVLPPEHAELADRILAWQSGHKVTDWLPPCKHDFLPADSSGQRVCVWCNARATDSASPCQHDLLAPNPTVIVDDSDPFAASCKVCGHKWRTRAASTVSEVQK